MPPRYVRRRLSASISRLFANPSKLADEQRSQPFPLLRLSPEILLRISTFWCEHPLGLPTECLNRLLYAMLSDPVAIAQRTLGRFRTVQIGFEIEVLRAESNGDFRAANILLAKGATVDSLPRTGDLILSTLLTIFLTEDHMMFDTLLMKACRHGALKAVKYLLERGANVNGHNFNGVSVIQFACATGNWDIVELLLSSGAQTTQSCLQSAVRTKQVQHVKLILDNTPADILATWEGIRDQHFFLIACENNDIAIINLLLKYGVPADAGLMSDEYDTDDGNNDVPINHTGLWVACERGHDSLVRLLIEHGADINVNSGVRGDLTPLLAACANGHKSTVRILLDAGAKINHDFDKGNAIFAACMKEDAELVRLLIERGANIEKGPKVRDYAPLHSASTVEIAQLILQTGVDINARDDEGMTAIYCALRNGKAPVVGFLLDQGADITIKDDYKRTPLSFLKDLNDNDREEMVAVLQDKGVMRRSSRFARK